MVLQLENISLDCHFARFVAGLGDQEDGDVFVAALLVSLATRRGDSCIHLGEWADRQLQLADGRSLRTPEREAWLDKLRRSPVVGSDGAAAPLVLEDDRLYLARYWEYEEEVADFLRRRGAAEDFPFDPEALGKGLDRVFPPEQAAEGPDWQRLAGLAVLLRSLVVIAGGPGTGKTTTVALVLAVLGEQYRLRGEGLRVALAAPTGKAALRLQETISRLREEGRLSGAEGEDVPGQVMTIHRLLGVINDTPFFRHNETNPLPYDLVVIDEASMVDLPLMAKLLWALSPRTRLVLLGDRHQLASVEPGSVLGDICDASGLAAFSKAFAANLGLDGEAAPPGPIGPGRLCDSLIELKRSRRFGGGSGIALLGRAVRDGDFAGAWECLQDPAYPEVAWRELAGPGQLDGWLLGLVASGEFSWLRGQLPEQILTDSNRFRVLCALRRGSFGAEQVSRRVQEAMAAGAENDSAAGGLLGQPIMILSNDYELQLYNGDTGVIWPGNAESAERRAYFPGPAGALRAFSLSRLPDYQAAYAMTVHKSQGSEFSRIALVLPDSPSPVLSRELLFTAVTRAREEVVICGTPEILAQAVATVSERRSGLGQKLWG